MKKNDMATFFVYLLMLGLAVLVGLAWIRPLISDYQAYIPLPGIVLVLFALLAGIILNAALLELGHLLGAKTGHYKVRSFVILGLGFKIKNGVKKKGFHKFSGLTGETAIVPMDPEKSRLGGYIAFPLLFLLVEVIGCAVMVGIGNAIIKSSGGDKSMAWMSIFGITILGIAGMLALYDYFPARLDDITDGYLMMATSKTINKVAYNRILLAEEAILEGRPVPDAVIYDEVTDFTYPLNLAIFYRAISENNSRRAKSILDKAIATEKGLSKSLGNHARCLKLNMLLEEMNSVEAKRMYEELDDGTKSYISALSTMAAVRSYMLISAFIENAEGECNYAVDKAEKALKNEEDNSREIEKALAEADLALVRKMHPGWTLSEFGWNEKDEEDEKESSEEPKE